MGDKMDDTFLPNKMDKLKEEIEMLKKKPSLERHEIYKADESDDTKEVMLSLTKSMNSLIRIFKEASNELKMDSHDAVLVSEKLDKIIDRLDKIETQNEKIAKGIIAVADMIEELKQRQVPRQMPSPMPISPQTPPTAPQIKPLPSYQMPQEEKKKGFSFKI